MSKTVVIQIGNSDDKLKQSEWSVFVSSIDEKVREIAYQVHFSGHSYGAAIWQNACWVIEMEESFVPFFLKELTLIRERFKQDSVAVTIGETIFV